MGQLMDMLPRIEAEIRMRDILESLGCTSLGCQVVIEDEPYRMGRWVGHNEEAKFFENIAEREPVPVFRVTGPWQHRLEPIAYIQSDIVAWIADQHRLIEANLETERQAAIDADPWRQHAEMVAGVR